MTKKRAQGWGLDLIAASGLFIVALLAFYYFSMNYSDQSNDIYNSMKYQADNIGDSLMSEGYPINWAVNNVVKPGLLSNNTINDTKLDQLCVLANNANYNELKSLFNMNYDFYINISQPISQTFSPDCYSPINMEVYGIGKLPPAAYQDLIKITRFTTYDNKTVTLTVYIWQ